MLRALIVLLLFLTACPNPVYDRFRGKLESIIKKYGGNNSAILLDPMPRGIRSKPTYIIRYTTEHPIEDEAGFLADLIDQFDLKHRYDRYLVLHNPEEGTKQIFNLRLAYLCSKGPVRRRYACLQRIREK